LTVNNAYSSAENPLQRLNVELMSVGKSIKCPSALVSHLSVHNFLASLRGGFVFAEKAPQKATEILRPSATQWYFTVCRAGQMLVSSITHCLLRDESVLLETFPCLRVTRCRSSTTGTLPLSAQARAKAY
jgi:hypothetical protein